MLRMVIANWSYHHILPVNWCFLPISYVIWNIYVVHIECKEGTLNGYSFTHISSPVIASQSRLPPLERTCWELYFMCQRQIRKVQHKTPKHQGKVSVPKVVFKLETHKVGLREQLMPLSNAENGNCKLIISSHFASQLVFSTHQLRYMKHLRCTFWMSGRHTEWVFFTHISSPVIASQSRLPPLERTCWELYFMCQRQIRKCNTKRQNIKGKFQYQKLSSNSKLIRWDYASSWCHCQMLRMVIANWSYHHILPVNWCFLPISYVIWNIYVVHFECKEAH
jgi:hypothetical protein